MVQHVYEQACCAPSLESVLIATDDLRIAQAAATFGAPFVMTDPSLPSGTDRCYAALQASGLEAGAIINIQGDEPFIPVENIEQVCRLLARPNADIATLYAIQRDGFDTANPNTVKLVRDVQGKALYFSRAQIPYPMNGNGGTEYESYLKHIGIYGYRKDVLAKLVALPQSRLELTERLEQLRWLENGYRICTDEGLESLSVDTEEDLERANDYFNTLTQ